MNNSFNKITKKHEDTLLVGNLNSKENLILVKRFVELLTKLINFHSTNIIETGISNCHKLTFSGALKDFAARERISRLKMLGKIKLSLRSRSRAY